MEQMQKLSKDKISTGSVIPIGANRSFFPIDLMRTE